jgi:HEAT repeat protein
MRKSCLSFILIFYLLSVFTTSAFTKENSDQYDSLLKELVQSGGSLNVANKIDRLNDEGNSLPVEPLLPLLSHKDSKVRKAASYTLRLIHKDKDGAKELLDAAKKEQDIYVLTEMVQGLGSMRDKAATELLSNLMLKHDNPDVRYEAVEAEYWIRDSNAVPFLIKAIEDTSLQVSNRALYVLGNIGDKRPLQRLEEVAKQDGDKKISAIQAIGMIGSPDSSDFLCTFLDSNDINLLKYVVMALRNAHNDKAVSSLLPLLKHENASIVEQTRLTLLEIGNDEVLKYFIKQYIADAKNDKTKEVIKALYGKRHGELGTPVNDFSSFQISTLARCLSGVSGRSIEPENISSIRSIEGVLFVKVTFKFDPLNYRGIDFIVIQTNETTFELASIIGEWIT